MLDYCENEHFEAECPEGHVLMIDHAHYGRMPGSRCINNAHGCEVDVTRLLDQHCSGRPSCDVGVANLVPADLQPCNMDYRSFLRATYTCIPGTQIWKHIAHNVQSTFICATSIIIFT